MNPDEAADAIAEAEARAGALAHAIRSAANEGGNFLAFRVGGGTETEDLASALSNFTIAAVGAAGQVGGTWPSTVEAATGVIATRVSALIDAMGEPPEAVGAFGQSPAERARTASIEAHARGCQQALDHFARSVTRGLEGAVEQERQRMQLERRKAKDPAPPRSDEPSSVVNVLLNVLHVAQFNINIINVQFTEAIEREAAKAPEPVREELRVLSIALRDAVASGDKGRMRVAIDALVAWVQHDQDRAIAALGVVVAIITLLLGVG